MHELHAVEWGSRRSSRVVICAHGYSGSGRDFDFLAQHLARDARVICPDMAGRGRSAWLPSPLSYNFPQFLSDLRALMAELRVDEVEWVGTSMGGLLGLMLAAQPRSPVTKLVLNDIGAHVPGEALAAIGRNLRSPASFESLAAVEAHLRHTHREWGPLEEVHWKHFVRHSARRTATGYALHYDPAIARLLPGFPVNSPFSLWGAWHGVRCPVLVLRGERSGILPLDVVRTMRTIKPGMRCIEIPDAGHVPSLMQQDQIAVVAQFLDSAAEGIERAA